jgi:hypothetical protein
MGIDILSMRTGGVTVTITFIEKLLKPNTLKIAGGTMHQEQMEQRNLRTWQQGAIFLLSCCVLVTRRPDAIFHAQFWAEDGRIFFADAYNIGPWDSLFQRFGGYFHAVPRIGAALALLAPLALAPLVLNLIAIAAQALPVCCLLSSRSSAWGSLRYRTFMCALYLALPNCRELGAIITNSQCVLSLSAFLLLVASPPRGRWSQTFDMLLFLLCGLSGPYCFFLAPIALFLAWKNSDRWRWGSAGALVVCSLIEMWGVIMIPYARPHYSLGASPALFVRLLAGHVYLGTVLGSNALAASPDIGVAGLLFLVAAGGTAILLICFLKSAMEMRLFILFSSMVFAASLISPFVFPPVGSTVWGLLTRAGGIHYWFFPSLAFAWTLLWCLWSRVAALKAVATVLLVLMVFGIALDWRNTSFKDFHFEEYAKRMEAAPVGTALTIPENPEGWNMRLVKRPPSR